MKPTVIYYRWVYSPSTEDVSLSHNHEGHPADIDFHSTMAERRPENDLHTGYAYRLDNGWKVTDEDHKPVDDPHIRLTVEKNIAKHEHREMNETFHRSSNRPDESYTSDAGESQLRYGAVFPVQGPRQKGSPRRSDSRVSD